MFSKRLTAAALATILSLSTQLQGTTAQDLSLLSACTQTCITTLGGPDALSQASALMAQVCADQAARDLFLG
ncbi:hypothetical protein HK102_009335, partial [Quaeritorhiza haematococci]